MIGNLVGLIVLIALAIGFAWLTRRAWRSKRGPIKWVGVVLAGLPTLLLGLLSVFAAAGMVKTYTPRGSPAPDITLAGTAEQIARGEHLAYAFCASCHSLNDQLPLSGGRDVGKDSPVPIGELTGANLTPAGRLKDWSDGEIFRRTTPTCCLPSSAAQVSSRNPNRSQAPLWPRPSARRRTMAGISCVTSAAATVTGRT